MNIHFTQGSDGLTKAAIKPPMQIPDFPNLQERVITVLDVTEETWRRINTLETVNSREISAYLEQHTPLKWYRVGHYVGQQVREVINTIKDGFGKEGFAETHGA